jgi:hypothetical protein
MMNNNGLWSIWKSQSGNETVQMHKFQTLSIFFASDLKYTPLVWSNITEVYGQTYTLKPNDRMLIMLMGRPS